MTIADLRALRAKAQNPTTEGVCETWYHPDVVDAMNAAYDALPALLDVAEAAQAVAAPVGPVGVNRMAALRAALAKMETP